MSDEDVRTQVAIIGAGPGGLLLAHLLHRQGIDSVVVEARSRSYVEQRVRAGIIEQRVVALLDRAGVAGRLRRECSIQDRFDIRVEGETIGIPLRETTGEVNTLYPQQELVKDLIAARLQTGAPLWFDAAAVGISGLEVDDPVVTVDRRGRTRRVHADFVAGADGSHGPSRAAIQRHVRLFERAYPSAWLGILAEALPPSMIGTYCWHPAGFALHSNRGPHTTRQYLEVPVDADPLDWSDARIWDELIVRSGASEGFRVEPGPILERTLVPLRASVVEPMSWRRMFLLGDAAHVFPPSGAKGLNVAVGDACVLARALGAWFGGGHRDLLDEYSDTCLTRAWQAQRYAHRLTTLLHRLDGDEFQTRVQRAELARLASDATARSDLARSSTSAAHIPAACEW
ncbi:MAG: 4-hydroxybenzoate 3-monooxygenase [Desertimonas sp.]